MIKQDFNFNFSILRYTCTMNTLWTETWIKKSYLRSLCKPLIFETQIIWFNKIHSLKYQRSATFGSKKYSNCKIRVCFKNSIPFLILYQMLIVSISISINPNLPARLPMDRLIKDKEKGLKKYNRFRWFCRNCINCINCKHV